MARLNVIVEGATEQAFWNRVLVPHLANHNVFASAQRVATNRKLGIKGGVVNYQKAKNHILRWLNQERGNDVFLTTMFDVYGLPTTFPGYEESRTIADPHQRVLHLEQAFQTDIGDRRFIAYLQLHEFEAILFCDPSQLAEFYPGAQKQIDELLALATQFASPELINDGEATAPSKRIASVLARYENQKPLVGPRAAAAIGLASIRKKCLHFHDWICRLESIGQTKGAP